MKTIYLFIIILAFSMTSPYAFACGEGGGEGSSGSIDIADNRSKVPYKFLKSSSKGNHNTRKEGAYLGGFYKPMIDKHWKKAINYMNKHSTQEPKTNKKADALDRTMGRKLGKLVTIILICEPDKSPKGALALALIIFMIGGEYK